MAIALDLKETVQPAGEPSSVVETWAAQHPPFAAEFELFVVAIASFAVAGVGIGPSFRFHQFGNSAGESSCVGPGHVPLRMSFAVGAVGNPAVAAAVVAAAVEGISSATAVAGDHLTVVAAGSGPVAAPSAVEGFDQRSSDHLVVAAVEMLAVAAVAVAENRKQRCQITF